MIIWYLFQSVLHSFIKKQTRGSGTTISNTGVYTFHQKYLHLLGETFFLMKYCSDCDIYNLKLCFVTGSYSDGGRCLKVSQPQGVWRPAPAQDQKSEMVCQDCGFPSFSGGSLKLQQIHLIAGNKGQSKICHQDILFTFACMGQLRAPFLAQVLGDQLGLFNWLLIIDHPWSGAQMIV